MRASILGLLMLSCACGALPPSGGDGGPSSGLDLNDVSFLYPLPRVGHFDQLMGLDADGGRGALLPRSLYDGLPVLEEGTTNASLWPQLRVVSARVDPCFPGSVPPAAPTCVKQVRLVAQPVREGTDGGAPVTTGDTAIHLLYALDDGDFAQVVDGVHQLKALAGTATDGQPLDVHPVMAAQGLDGAYARELDALVLQVCGSQTLVRVAFMQVNSQDTVWTFGAFDVSGGALHAATIPRIGTHTLQGFQEFGNEAFRSGTLMPAAPNDDFPTLLSESEMRLADDGLLARALTSALRLEHPARSSPKTVDCASCHAASRARHHAEVQRSVDDSQHPDAFHAARFDLQRVDGARDDPKAQRAFGYFGAASALSLRTINESAVVADSL